MSDRLIWSHIEYVISFHFRFPRLNCFLLRWFSFASVGCDCTGKISDRMQAFFFSFKKALATKLSALKCIFFKK